MSTDQHVTAQGRIGWIKKSCCGLSECQNMIMPLARQYAVDLALAKGLISIYSPLEIYIAGLKETDYSSNSGQVVLEETAPIRTTAEE